MTVMSSDCGAPAVNSRQGAEHARDRLLRGQAAAALQHFLQPPLGIEVLLRVHRLRHAVGEEKDGLAGRELHSARLVCRFRKQADYHAAGFVDGLQLARWRDPVRRIVPAEAVLQLAGVGMQDSVKHRHEDPGLALAAQHLVGITQTRGGFGALQRDGLQQGPAHRHEQRRRNPLPGDVADYETEPLLVDQEEVVEIAADHAGRRHLGVNAEVVAAGAELARQNRRLNARRDLELLLDGIELIARGAASRAARWPRACAAGCFRNPRNRAA